MINKDIFDNIYRTHYSQLYYFALQYVNDTEACHDITHTLFEDMWRNLDTIKAETIKGYLYSNIRNKCIDYLRKRKIRDKYISYACRSIDTYIEEREFERQDELDKTLANILGMLGEPTFSILKSCYLDEKKYKEVAEEMGISIATVKKHMIKALKTLRENKKNIKQVT